MLRPATLPRRHRQLHARQVDRTITDIILYRNSTAWVDSVWNTVVRARQNYLPASRRIGACAGHVVQKGIDLARVLSCGLPELLLPEFGEEVHVRVLAALEPLDGEHPDEVRASVRVGQDPHDARPGVGLLVPPPGHVTAPECASPRLPRCRARPGGRATPGGLPAPATRRGPRAHRGGYGASQERRPDQPPERTEPDGHAQVRPLPQDTFAARELQRHLRPASRVTFPAGRLIRSRVVRTGTYPTIYIAAEACVRHEEVVCIRRKVAPRGGRAGCRHL